MTPRIDIAAVLARVQAQELGISRSDYTCVPATPLALLRTMREQGRRLRLDRDHLYVEVTTSTLSLALLAALRQHQDALLTLLEWYEERAGILEYAGGLSRADAERDAWTQMVVFARQGVYLGPRGDR